MFSLCSYNTFVSVLSRRSNTFSSIILFMFNMVSWSSCSPNWLSWPNSPTFYLRTIYIDSFWIVSKYMSVYRFLSSILAPAEAAKEFLSWMPWIKLLFISTSCLSSIFSRFKVSTFTDRDLCAYKASFKSFSIVSFIFSVLVIAICMDSISDFKFDMVSLRGFA